MMRKKEMRSSSRRGITRKAQTDAVTSSAAKKGKRRLVKSARQTYEAEDDLVKCASPPCYLSEIED